MIFGQFNRTTELDVPPDKSDLQHILTVSTSNQLSAYIPADRKDQWHDKHIALVQHTTWNTEESLADQGPLLAESAGVTLVAWARIDNRDELAHALAIKDNVDTPDSMFILAAYQKWGDHCVQHLYGDFAFAIWNARQKTLFCARDHMGTRPFYYLLESQRLLFATTLKVFRCLSNVELHPRDEWMARYMLHLSMDFEQTPYKGIVKLPPGHYLKVTPHAHQLVQYHQLNGEHTIQLSSTEEYVEAYREQLERAIRCRLRSHYKLGSELSGGIDSSTITCYASQMLPSPQTDLHAFAFATHEKEPEYIHAVSQRYPMVATHVVGQHGSRDQSQVIKRAMNILGYPMEHATSIGHMPFYQLASQSNVRTLLSGFGGDEFVTQKAHAALTEWLNQRRWRQLYRNLRGNALTRALRLLKLISLARQSSDPMLQAFYNKLWADQLLNNETVERFLIKQAFFEQAHSSAGYDTLNEVTLANHWTPFVPTRMENCTLMAAAHKIEYRWPLLDVRLVQFFLNIPAEEKYEKGIGRLLHRRAIKPIVPEKIVWKSSKHMGRNLNKNETETQEPHTKPAHIHEALKPLLNRDLLDAQYHKNLSKIETADQFSKKRNLTKLHWLNTWLDELSV